MTIESPWYLLRAGNWDEGLRRMREALEQKETTSRVIALGGTAYLWGECYQAAWEHFDAANLRRPMYISNYYGMAGVAKWCMNEKREAVAQWQGGLKCQYADGAGGVTTPLLLFAAAILDPALFSRVEAEKFPDGPRQQPPSADLAGPHGGVPPGTHRRSGTSEPMRGAPGRGRFPGALAGRFLFWHPCLHARRYRVFSGDDAKDDRDR